jgi:tripartite-type tricarboxylate transporter receptor subunit TctC
MKKLFLIAAACFSISAFANTLTILHPNTPGSVSDTTSRIIASGYTRLTGENVIVDGIGGGSHIPAIVNWKLRSQPTIFLTTSTSLVFNPKLLKDLPYSDTDFNHVTMISEVVNAWVVRADAPYQTLSDVTKNLVTSKKPFVAYANHSEVVNYHLMAQKFGWGSAVVPVKYKGVPETIAGLLEGSVEVAVVSINPMLIGQIQSGALRVIGHTSTGTLDIGGTSVKSATDQVGVKQFNGFIGLAVPSTMDSAQAETIKQHLIKVLDDPEVRAALRKQNSFVVNRGPDHKKQYIKEFRAAIQPLEFN